MRAGITLQVTLPLSVGLGTKCRLMIRFNLQITFLEARAFVTNVCCFSDFSSSAGHAISMPFSCCCYCYK